MKGMELPINILIIIAIAVIVLIAVIAMFYPSFSSGSQTVVVENVKSQACQVLMSKNCQVASSEIKIENFDADQDGTFDPQVVWCWGDDDPPISVCVFAGGPVKTCKDVGGSERDNLGALCKCYYQIDSNVVGEAEKRCKALCGC